MANYAEFGFDKEVKMEPSKPKKKRIRHDRTPPRIVYKAPSPAFDALGPGAISGEATNAGLSCSCCSDGRPCEGLGI